MWAITDRLYLGNYWSGEQALIGAKAPLHPSGEQTAFSGIVSLCPMPLDGDTLLAPIDESIQWLHVPIADGGMGEGEFAAALELCLPFVEERRAFGNVLVHCAAGVSRSVSVVAAVLCQGCPGLDIDDAYRQIAHAKALAVGASAGDEDLLVAPAWEFDRQLRRRYGEPRGRANGRSLCRNKPRK